MVGIILYIRNHPRCRRMELYRSVAHNDRMTVKIDMLISEGIVENLSADSRCSTLMLTPIGEKVAEHLQSIADLLDYDNINFSTKSHQDGSIKFRETDH